MYKDSHDLGIKEVRDYYSLSSHEQEKVPMREDRVLGILEQKDMLNSASHRELLQVSRMRINSITQWQWYFSGSEERKEEWGNAGPTDTASTVGDMGGRTVTDRAIRVMRKKRERERVGSGCSPTTKIQDPETLQQWLLPSHCGYQQNLPYRGAMGGDEWIQGRQL